LLGDTNEADLKLYKFYSNKRQAIAISAATVTGWQAR
jgi:hypothetical protein